MVDKLLKNIAVRLLDGFVDTVKLLFSTAMSILVILMFALVLHFVPVWIVITAIIVLLITISYFTYREELQELLDKDD